MRLLIRTVVQATKPRDDERPQGPWVVVAVVPMSGRAPLAVPLLGAKPFAMRGYPTAEEAIASTVNFPAGRSYGGIVLNIQTGRTVRFKPFKCNTQVP